MSEAIPESPKSVFTKFENPVEFQQLFQALCADHRPATITQEIFVYKLAEALWFSKRAARLLADAIDRAAPNEISLYLRFHASAERSAVRTLAELRKLQKDHPPQEIGFVPQNDPPPIPAPKPAPAQSVPPQPQPEPKIGFVPQKTQPTPITIRRDPPKTGRNEICPCGSGKKFKRCCLAA